MAVGFFLWMPTISAHLQDWEAPPAGSMAEGARLMVLVHFRTLNSPILFTALRTIAAGPIPERVRLSPGDQLGFEGSKP